MAGAGQSVGRVDHPLSIDIDLTLIDQTSSRRTH
jgi:hypothetical protein